MKTNNSESSRAEFLGLAAGFITIPSLLSYCASLPEARVVPQDESDTILKILQLAITAPNPHNTQAWKFRITGDNELLTYIDETRLLPATDPTFRQIHIGHGCMLETLKIAAEGQGYSAQINLFPEGLKDTSGGQRPVSRIKLLRVQESRPQSALYRSLLIRRTDRTEYTGPQISRAESGRIQELCGSGHSIVSHETDKAKVERIISLCARSMETESFTYKTDDETRTWFHFSDREIREKRDGLALPDQGVTGFNRFVAENFFLSSDPKVFHDPDGIRTFLKGYNKRIASARGIVMWTTGTNTPEDWVRTGFDYVRYQLAAASLGLVIHPMSQFLQEYREMDPLRKEFEALVPVPASGKVQMFARIGRSSATYFTPRRPLAASVLR